MSKTESNPTGSELAESSIVEQSVSRWRYSDEDKQWFLQHFQHVPHSAQVAGAFSTNVLEVLKKSGNSVTEALQRLGYRQVPSKFRLTPLNHFLLTAIDVAHAVGGNRDLASDQVTIQEAINRAMFAALIRRTLPGFTGTARVGEMLRLVGRAFSGVLFTHLQIQTRQEDDRWTLIHKNEYNFLAHFHYAEAYYQLLGGDDAAVERVEFEWVEHALAHVYVYL